jgi:tetratricopeptide (TPR) repeat protein
MKDKGLIQEAIHCYVTAVRLMPKFAAAHSNLGSVLKEQGKLDQALAHYKEAIHINPLFPDAHSNMGNTYKDMGKVEQAMECYLRAIEISPKFADAHCNLASLYRDIHQVTNDSLFLFSVSLYLSLFSQRLQEKISRIRDLEKSLTERRGIEVDLKEKLEQSESKLSVTETERDSDVSLLIFPCPLCPAHLCLSLCLSLFVSLSIWIH